MKKMMTLAMMMTIAISAAAMNYNAARSEALFLSDKMAYELGLTEDQYAAVYEINLDYLMCVNGRNDAYGSWWSRRNADLMYVLTSRQYSRFAQLAYFYRPLTWHAGSWRFDIYSHYSRDRFFRTHPSVYRTYRGGHNRHADHYAHFNRPAAPSHGTWHERTHVDRRHAPAAPRHDNRHGRGRAHRR